MNDGGGGWYQGTFTPAAGETSFSIVVTCNGQQSTATGSLWTVPDGVVYDAREGLSNPLAGTTVTCERYDVGLNVWTTWDAWNYPYGGVSQANPQVTDVDGYYSFLVPPGSYRVRAVLDGYTSFTSGTRIVTDTPVYLDIPLWQLYRAYLPLVTKE